jgi:hypothetical protein
MRDIDKRQPQHFEPQAKYGTTTPAYEASDAPIRPLFFFGVVLFTVAAVITVLLFFMYAYYQRKMAREDMPMSRLPDLTSVELPPVPRLQVSPMTDLRMMREDEDKVLTTYEVDAATSRARIPVTQAMALLVESGQVPTRAPAGAALDAGTTQPQDSSSGRTGEFVR